MSKLPPDFLFQLSFPCRHLATVPEKITAAALSEEFTIPYGVQVGRTTIFQKDSSHAGEGTSSSGETKGEFVFRLGWHEKGILVTFFLRGKKLAYHCDPTKLETSDGLRLCLDTRDVRDVHRATRFCHRFLFLPTGPGQKPEEAMASWLPIHRAKMHPNPVDVSQFRMASRPDANELAFSVFIPGETLSGYEPLDHSRLGFHFSYFDAELGIFALQHTFPFPVEEDPSLWSVLDCVK